MTFKIPPHLNGNIYQNQIKTQTNGKAHGGVWRDNDGSGRVRAASHQPVILEETQSTRRSNTNTQRSQKRSTSRKLRQVASWVDDPIVLQLQDLARSQNLSMSETIRGLLTEILRQKFHQQQAATLPELIDKAVAKSNRTFATRMSWLLVRIAFDTGETRVLAASLLGRSPGVTEEVFKENLDTATKRARANITRKTPQIEELVKSVEKWLLEGEEVAKTN